MRCKTAFSLVELSIVLVILGLLTGGILAGQSLIRASELRAVSTEYQRYAAAKNSFRDKYFALPGDMTNAYAFWGAACGTNATTPSTGCNGNGDGVIRGVLGENTKAWEHLSRAGMIEGSYDGTGTFDGTTVIPTPSNVPHSRFPSAYWEMTDVYSNCSGPLCPDNKFVFGTINTGDEQLDALPTMTQAEAWNIDTKMDDGRASSGAVRGDDGGTCFDQGTDYYSLQGGGANTTSSCVLYFLQQ